MGYNNFSKVGKSTPKGNAFDSMFSPAQESSHTLSDLRAECLWQAYPKYENWCGNPEQVKVTDTDQVWEMAGNNINDMHVNDRTGEYYNSCALRVSIAILGCIENIPYVKGVTNKNFTTKKRYIISAANLMNFLVDSLEDEPFILKTESELTSLRQSLTKSQTIISVNSGHAALIRRRYFDEYTPYSTDVYGGMKCWTFS